MIQNNRSSHQVSLHGAQVYRFTVPRFLMSSAELVGPIEWFFLSFLRHSALTVRYVTFIAS